MLVCYSTSERQRPSSVWRIRFTSPGKSRRESRGILRKRSICGSPAICPDTPQGVRSARCTEQASLLERMDVLVHTRKPHARSASDFVAPPPDRPHCSGHRGLDRDWILDCGALGTHRTRRKTSQKSMRPCQPVLCLNERDPALQGCVTRKAVLQCVRQALFLLPLGITST